jgi:Phosphatidylethanolamine-binding protein
MRQSYEAFNLALSTGDDLLPCMIRRALVDGSHIGSPKGFPRRHRATRRRRRRHPRQELFGNAGYNGPGPARARFASLLLWVYALDTDLDREPGLDRVVLPRRIEDHVIEQARLVGTYER